MFHLKDRAVIAASGPEARSFLQGLITNDINGLDALRPLYAALLTPQGKILFDFILCEHEGAVMIDCWAPAAETLLKRLAMYRLRAKFDLQARSDLAVLWSPAQRAEHAFEDPRLRELGYRAVRPSQPDLADGTEDYLTRRLGLGIPEGGDFGSDKIFALDGGLEELHGISFEKGCYVGQELTARMKHRGTARKRLLPVVSSDGGSLPEAGTEIRAGHVALGEIASTYGSRGFGLIRLDRWKEAGMDHAEAAGQPLRIVKPDWLERKGSQA